MTERRAIRRVLAVLDASPGSLAAARAAAQLAALFEAELAGVFIEDVELLNLSALPLARRVDGLTAALRPLESREVERHLRIHASRARGELEQVARQVGVTWSFRIARGTVPGAVLQAAAGADLVSLGRAGWSGGRLLSATVRTVLRERQGRILLLERSADIRPPVLVIYDGSESAGEALELAAFFTRGHARALVVFLLGKGAEELRGKAGRQLAELGVRAEMRVVHPEGLQRAVTASCRRGAGLLVAPQGGEDLDDQTLLALLDEVDCPILVVS